MVDGRGTSWPLVGRDDEVRLLLRDVRGAADGHPCAVLVHGEAGVGKTSLVRAVMDTASAEGTTVLWAPCLRFGAVEATYLPLVLALESWVDSAEPADVERVVGSVDGAAALLPSRAAPLGGQKSGPESGPVRLLSVVHAMVSRVATLAPTVMVVDDVQWADPATWDAIAFLVAGFHGQRLAVVATYRDEEVEPDHPMFGWLADIRRLPSVRETRLERLSRQATARQLASLLGDAVDPLLAVEVFERSQGNPYLSELLVAGLDPGTQHLPDALPDALSQALLAAWHRLSPTCREVMRVLAVVGRPVGIDSLGAVSTSMLLPRDIGLGGISGVVAEATAHGIVVLQEGGVWFRHPLLAEVLTATLLPGEAAPLHSAWAETLTTTRLAGMDELRRLGALALHHEGAGDVSAALAASLEAADLARSLHALREEALHLRRAARLWPAATKVVQGRSEGDVLVRAARTSHVVGESEQAIAHAERALALVDEAAEPLRYGRLLAWYGDLCAQVGLIPVENLEYFERAVALCASYPGTAEHALTLAALGEAAVYSGNTELARSAVERAVESALRSGDPEALTAAYVARIQADPAAPTSDSDSLEAMRCARLVDDPRVRSGAALQRWNYLVGQGRVAEQMTVIAEARLDALSAGATSNAMLLGETRGLGLLDQGRLIEAGEVIAESLALRGGTSHAARLRLTAAILAARLNRPDAARLHLARARELIPSLDVLPGFEAPPALAELMLVDGTPQEAVEMISRTMRAHSVDPRVVDLMVLWGARATADLAQQARDRRDETTLQCAVTDLDRLVAMRAALPGEPFRPGSSHDLVHPAQARLFQAERARAIGDPHEVDAWLEAVLACERADLVWDLRVSQLRHAECLLRDRAGRTEAGASLRVVHAYAIAEGADGLRNRVEELAQIGRVSLQEPRLPRQQTGRKSPLGSLTGREREVLGYLVAGRTYAEIAAALFISEKTVSVHVSNLLRKSGTTSRQEVATLAVRLEGSG